jgi:flavin reductase (DIM6/NTAB) family NADH-FMN oxidoreductase RutF
MEISLKPEFRKAMRSLASTVSVISTADKAGRFGMTATAVCSLSIDPPAILICLNRSASLHQPLLGAGMFCVNVLHADQDALAQAFSRKDSGDRFAWGNWKTDERGIPVLADAQASVFCDVNGNYNHGTHSIVIGAVHGVLARDQIHPVLYQDGQYTVGLARGIDWVIPVGG